MKKNLLLMVMVLCLSLFFVSCQTEDVAPESDVDSSATETVAFLTVTAGGDSYLISKEDFEALPMVEHEISRTNSKDETHVAVYKGVKWAEIANFVGIPADAATVIAVASDGYEVAITADMLADEQSMFALYEDGEPIESQDGGEIWFAAGEAYTANNWAKYIVELKVE